MKRVTITTIRKALREVESDLDVKRSGDALHYYVTDHDDGERAGIIFQQARAWLRENGYQAATSIIVRSHMVVFAWNVRHTPTDDLIAANID